MNIIDNKSNKKLKKLPYLDERVNAAVTIIKEFCKKYNKRSITIADLGGGDGKATRKIISLLNPHFEIDEFFVVDLKPDIKLQQEFSFIRIQIHDFNKKGIPITDESVDVVYSLETIEHLYNTDIFLEEIKRILKPAGLLVISSVNLLAWYNRVLMLLGSLPVHYEVSNKKKYGRFKIIADGHPVGHIRVFSPKALIEILTDLGFEIYKCSGIQFIYNNKILSYADRFFKYVLNLSSAFIIAAIKRGGRT